MNTITERRVTTTARQAREGVVKEVTSGGAFYELVAERGAARKGPAIVPDDLTVSTGDQVAVIELDTGKPLIIARWTS